jgi:hypothetical protein
MLEPAGKDCWDALGELFAKLFGVVVRKENRGLRKGEKDGIFMLEIFREGFRHLSSLRKPRCFGSTARSPGSLPYTTLGFHGEQVSLYPLDMLLRK